MRGRRIKCLILAAALFASSPFSASAATDENEPESVSQEESEPELTPQQKLDQGKWKFKGKHVCHYNKDGKKTKGFVTIKKKKYYFTKKGIQRTGWRKIKGGYYFFRIKNKSGGYMMKSKTVNGIRLKKNGRAKVTNAAVKRKLDFMVLCAKRMDGVTNARMTQLQKLRAAYDYELTHYRLGGSATFYYEANWDLTYAERIYRDWHGACYEWGALYAYYANAVGAKNCCAVSSGGHGWAEVNGRVFDPNWEYTRKIDLFNMDYSLSGIGGRPGYKNARKYVKRI